MELLSAIEARRSIRKYKSTEVSDELIDSIISAGILAPSGTNLQPTRYVVIKDKKTREKLRDCTPLSFVSEAPVVLACLIDMESIGTVENRMNELREVKAFKGTPLDEKPKETEKTKSSRFSDLDAVKSYLSLNAAIAIDHMTLRAVDLGLGTCWVMMFDREKLRNLLNLEKRYEAIALLPIGYPDQSPDKRPRLDYDSIVLKTI